MMRTPGTPVTAPRPPGAAGDANPVNRGLCPLHGRYSGLICTKCVVALPTPSSGARR